MNLISDITNQNMFTIPVWHDYVFPLEIGSQRGGTQKASAWVIELNSQ